jgi:pimeloyl-ACP methyl ester carboxylesterase
MGEVMVAGRRLRFDVYGEDGAAVVVHCHGTPGSRAGVRPSESALRTVGARVVTYDRPGYGGSDPQPGRRVADAAGDVAAIADALGVETIAVYGISGGGPHALACAALLPDRVTRVAAMVGLAPYDADGLDWYAGMTQSNVDEMSAAVDGPAALAALLEPDLAAMRDDPATLLNQLDAVLPDPDRTVLRDPVTRAMLLDSFTEAITPGVGGWIDDDIAFVGGWGFEVTGIRVPVLLWHGTEDVLAPAGHTEWLSRRVPSATYVRATGAGHLAAYQAQDSVLRWLVHGDGPAGDSSPPASIR